MGMTLTSSQKTSYGTPTLDSTAKPGLESKASAPSRKTTTVKSGSSSHYFWDALKGVGKGIGQGIGTVGKLFVVVAIAAHRVGATGTPTPFSAGSDSWVTPSGTPVTQTPSEALLPTSASPHINFAEDLISELAPGISEFIASGAYQITLSDMPELLADFDVSAYAPALDSILRGLSQHEQNDASIGVYHLLDIDSAKQTGPADPADFPHVVQGTLSNASTQFPNLRLGVFRRSDSISFNRSAFPLWNPGFAPLIGVRGLTTTDSPLHVMSDGGFNDLASAVMREVRQFGGWVAHLPISDEPRGLKGDRYPPVTRLNASVVMYAPPTQRSREAFERLIPMLSKNTSVLYFEPPTPTPTPTSTSTPTQVPHADRKLLIIGGVAGVVGLGIFFGAFCCRINNPVPGVGPGVGVPDEVIDESVTPPEVSDSEAEVSVSVVEPPEDEEDGKINLLNSPGPVDTKQEHVPVGNQQDIELTPLVSKAEGDD